MSIISSPRPASATEPKPSPTPTSTGSPEPSPQRPGTVPQGASGRQQQDATLASAPESPASGSRRRSLYAGQLAISAAAKPPNRLISTRHAAPRADKEERAESARAGASSTSELPTP